MFLDRVASPILFYCTNRCIRCSNFMITRVCATCIFSEAGECVCPEYKGVYEDPTWATQCPDWQAESCPDEGDGYDEWNDEHYN